MSVKSNLDALHLIDCTAMAALLDDVKLLNLRPADDYALRHIACAKHLDLYQVSLTNSAPEPLEAFLSMFHGSDRSWFMITKAISVHPEPDGCVLFSKANIGGSVVTLAGTKN